MLLCEWCIAVIFALTVTHGSSLTCLLNGPFHNQLPRSQCRQLTGGVSNTEAAEIHKSIGRAHQGMRLARGETLDEEIADDRQAAINIASAAQGKPKEAGGKRTCGCDGQDGQPTKCEGVGARCARRGRHRPSAEANTVRCLRRETTLNGRPATQWQCLYRGYLSRSSGVPVTCAGPISLLLLPRGSILLVS